jgi:hypothetical protein
LRKYKTRLTDYNGKIAELDSGYRFYSIHIPSMSDNPMEIKFFRKVNGSDPIHFATQIINFLDLYFTSRCAEQIDNEVTYLKDNDAPKEQLDELLKIRKLFSV